MADPVNNPYVQAFTKNLTDLRKAGAGETGIAGLMAPDMQTVSAREAQLKNYLGSTDYSKQLEESQNMGKLQLALALAQRGFAAAGATPQRGESSVSTLSRELLSPLAGDAGSVAGRMMQQRQALKAAERQEDRQLKLSALQQITSEDAALRDLAKASIPKAGTGSGLLETPYYVIQKGEGGNWSFVPQAGGQGQTQVRQQKGTGAPYNIQTRKLQPLQQGQTIVRPSDLGKYGLGEPEGSKNAGGLQAGEFNLEKPDGSLFKVTQDGKTRTPVYRAIVKGPDRGKFVDLGTNAIFSQTELEAQGLSPRKITTGTGVTDADKTVEANRNLLLTSMNRLQNQQLQGPNTPYSAKSALYFDVGAYQAGKFAFRYIRPGTDPLEAAAKSVPITNERFQKYITKKVNSLADTTLKTDFGSANQEIKEARLSKAIRSILNETPQMLFGAQNIPTLGVTGDGENVGYTPTTAAFDPALQTEKLKTAVRTLKEDPSANPTITYGPVAFPSSQEFLNKTTGRIKVATELFPDAFSDQQVAGTEAFDPDMVQRRRDIEAALPRATLTIGASNDDYRKVISDGAAKVSVARDKLQNSTDARSAKESFLLFRQFREGLLDFKNAARESKVEGFFTGRVAAGLSRLGLAKFISGEGAEHWARLTAASDRFQEGISRRVGKDFGDDRISNLDAAAYQKLVADIKKGKDFNRILVDDGLSRIKNNMTDLMSRGGRVGWTERDLRQASEAGVDFSELRTMENWHGHGYYGKDRYSATRQQTPSLSQNQRDVIRTQGQLKDTMYGGQYTVPNVDYSTDAFPTFQRGTEATEDESAIAATEVLRKGPIQFDIYIEKLADNADVSVDVMRRRVVQGIISYNTFREQIR